MRGLRFSPNALKDFQELSEYLRLLPARPSLRIAKEVRRSFKLILEFPHLGQAHSRFTLFFGQEVRSVLVASYRIYYFSANQPEIIAIIHTARDPSSIMANRTP